MADVKNFVKYGVAKTSFNSSRQTWDEAKSWEYAYIMTEGLGVGTFFTDEVFDTKEEAQSHSYKVRDWAAYDRSRARSGYASYKDRIWVHEYIKKPGYREAYLPTVGEIRKGLEYIQNNLKSENYRKEWVDWMVAHENMKPAQIRQELIDEYLK